MRSIEDGQSANSWENLWKYVKAKMPNEWPFIIMIRGEIHRILFIIFIIIIIFKMQFQFVSEHSIFSTSFDRPIHAAWQCQSLSHISILYFINHICFLSLWSLKKAFQFFFIITLSFHWIVCLLQYFLNFCQWNVQWIWALFDVWVTSGKSIC